MENQLCKASGLITETLSVMCKNLMVILRACAFLVCCRRNRQNPVRRATGQGRSVGGHIYTGTIWADGDTDWLRIGRRTGVARDSGGDGVRCGIDDLNRVIEPPWV